MVCTQSVPVSLRHAGEEVILDLALNPNPWGWSPRNSPRSPAVILNHFTASVWRLCLSATVKRLRQVFGRLETDIAKQSPGQRRSIVQASVHELKMNTERSKSSSRATSTVSRCSRSIAVTLRTSSSAAVVGDGVCISRL